MSVVRNILCMFMTLAAVAAAGCGGTATGDLPFDAKDDTIQTRADHTVPSFVTPGDFLAYAGAETEPAQVKFIIRDFQDSGVVHFEEPGFFSMHDEWSWFSLLNGIEIPEYDFGPLSGYSFDTVADIVEWARARDSLPLDLRFVAEGTRLYSPLFYDRAFNRTSDTGTAIPRFFGCGSVLHFPADARRKIPGETWAFELEYADAASVADVERFFEILSRVLPEGVGDRMIWLVRSTVQKNVASKIDQSSGPLAGRWATWDDLLVPGEEETYNPGISAGIVKIFEPGELPVVDAAKTVAVLREIPDDLPPVAAIITNVPQTPLSHIGILAKARGTPNLYVAGIADNDQFQTWAAYRRSIIVQATADGHRFREMSGAEWNEYLTLITPRLADIEPVDVSTMPETYDPLTGTPADMKALIPMIGGKTAGFLMLHNYPELDLPDKPFGLTVRGYNEFIATMDPPLDQVMADPAMTDARVALAVTEGPQAYLDANGGSDSAQQWLEAIRLAHEGDVIGRAIEAGGIRQMVMTAPMDAGYLGCVTTALSERFAFLAPEQGLRFRSSSSAEDVEGFNGAGLYESHTGYLHPELQEPKKQDKTVSDALRRVWASYWLYNAFQERNLAGIDHLAANMGVLVHPVFDDDHEAANGVLTLELVRRPEGDVATLTANMQKGALSVTNPPPGSTALPEVDVVTRRGLTEPEIDRQRASTEVSDGEWLLSESELLDLLDVFARMASDWLDLRNTEVLSAQQRSTLTVDAEIKRMSAGWPKLKDGTINPRRLVLKQARTIERPVLAGEDIQAMPVPRDLLAYTVKVEKMTCEAAAMRADVYQFFTNPSQDWPFDYAEYPFVAYATVLVNQAMDGFPWVAGAWFMLTHQQASFVLDPVAATWKLVVTPADPAAKGFQKLTVNAAGAWSIDGADGAHAEGTDMQCTTTVLMTSAQAFLESLING